MRKKFMLKIMIVILSIVMVFGIGSIPVFAEAVASGSCGDNLTWTLTTNEEDSSTYTLTISGSGAMTDYGTLNTPWNNYMGNIKKLVLGDQITSIGTNAFWASPLTGSLVIPDSVTSIGNGAFLGCKQLTGNLTIGKNVMSIGDSAFKQCTGFMGTLNIPDSVTTISANAFKLCNGFDKVIIPKSVTSIANGSFLNLKSGKTIYNLSNVSMTAGTQYTTGTLGDVYTVTTFVDGQSTSTTKVVGDGASTFTVEEPKKENYKFAGWYSGDGTKWDLSTPLNSTTVPTGTLELTAKWKSVPPAQGDVTINYVNKTLDTQRTDLEYCEQNNNTWKKIVDFKAPLTNFGGIPCQVRVVSGSDYEASDSIEIFIIGISGSPSISDSDIQVTENSITLRVSGNMEYGIKTLSDPVVWQDSNVLTGLSPNTEYTVCARFKATNSSFASSEYSKNITTAKMSLTGTPTASGTYGQNLTQLSITGEVKDSSNTIVNGTWNFSTVTEAAITYPTVGGTTKYTATFTPNENPDKYQELQGEITPVMRFFETNEVATLSGTVGEAGWYTSDVTVLAPQGYKISQGMGTQESNWNDSFTTAHIEGAMKVQYYLRQNTTGFITAQKDIDVNIDKAKPSITLSYGSTEIFLDWIMGRENLKITATAVDYDSNALFIPGSGVGNVTFTLTSENGEETQRTVSTECIKEGFSVKYVAELTVPANWKGKIKADCRDRAGFTANSVYVGKADGTTGAIVEKNTPIITVTEPAKTVGTLGFKDTATFSASVTDTDGAASTITGGLKAISYTVDGDSAQTVTIPNAGTGIVTKHEFNIILNTVGSHTVVITAQDNAGNTTIETKNYKIYGETTVALTQIGTPIYDGATIVEGTDFTLNKGGSTGEVSYQYKVQGTDDSTYVIGLPINVGSYTIKASIAQDDISCYTVQTKTCDITIGKKTVSGIPQEFSVVKGLAKEYSFDLYKLLPASEQCKNVQYSVGSVTNSDSVLTDPPTPEDIVDGKLKLKIANVGEKGKTSKVEIRFTSDNHTIANAAITIKTIDKTPLNITNVQMPDREYNGSVYEYTGTPTFTNSTTNDAVTGVIFSKEYVGTGTTSYAKSETAPTNAGTYKLIISVPTDNENYTGEAEIPFTIDKKEITVKADDKSIYVGGSIPKNSALTYTVTGLIGSDTLKTVPTLTLDAKAVSTSASTYTITVTGAAVGDNYNVTMKNGTFNVTAAPYIPPYNPPTPQPKTETREVPVVVDNGGTNTNAAQVPVTRTTDSNGTKTDTVKFDEDKAKQTVTKALETKTNTATISVTDIPGNNADKVEVQVPQSSMTQLGSNNIGLNVKTEKAALELPKETVSGLKDKDAKIQISEVKDSSEVEETKGLILKLASGSEVIKAPLKIEANFTGRTKITLPIDTSKLPSSKEELDKFLSSLAVMVQHSDGENAIDKGTIVYDEKGKPIGISIWVDKFSDFTLVSLPESYFEGRTTVMKDKVAADKEWNIKFTKIADSSTITKDNVYVTDLKGNRVEVEVSYGSDNILKVTPVNPYKSGETYYLYISKNVKSKNKTSLVNELRYQFTIK